MKEQVDQKDIKNLQDSIEGLKAAIDRLDKAILSFSETFVTKTELNLIRENFNLKINPLQRVVYTVMGAAGLILIGAILAQVIIQK